MGGVRLVSWEQPGGGEISPACLLIGLLNGSPRPVHPPDGWSGWNGWSWGECWPHLARCSDRQTVPMQQSAIIHHAQQCTPVPAVWVLRPQNGMDGAGWGWPGVGVVGGPMHQIDTFAHACEWPASFRLRSSLLIVAWRAKVMLRLRNKRHILRACVAACCYQV
jgi:hypothetical protein